LKSGDPHEPKRVASDPFHTPCSGNAGF
jgi:hypothetical protein